MGTSWADHKSKKSQQQWTISWSDCDMQQKMDFTRQPETTSWVTVPQRSPKALSKATHTKKRVMVTVYWSVAHLIHYSFLNPGKTISSTSMLCKLMRCTKNCHICSWHWPIFLHNNAPPHVTQPTLQKLNEWAIKSCLFCDIQLTSRQLPLFQASWQLFFRENVFTTSRRQKMLSKNSRNPKAWIFMLQE